EVWRQPHVRRVRPLARKNRIPLRDSVAYIGIGTPCKQTNTSAIHAAWASASTAVSNAQLPGEARDCEKGTDLFIPTPTDKMAYDLEESKIGDVIHAKSWSGGIA
ncbi:MAG: hypothetical protein Q8O37_08775, partial [Sulfuricellaceae bacterium]|nr:hypothetical protein [Sulfuricellaceae bacterium]